MTKKRGSASQAVMESYQHLLAGTQTVGVNAVILNIGTRVESFTCIIQAAHANAGTVYLGNQQGQYFELEAGEALTVPVSGGDVYLKASQAGQIVNWLAGG